MRLTRASEYAIRCILYLAKQGQGLVISKNEIAAKTDTPPQYLAKIGQQLSQAGIIEILQGSRGGFRLLIGPEKVSILHVIEAIKGGISLNDCVSRPESCPSSPNCAVHQVWLKANKELRDTLNEADFATLAQEKGCCLQPPQQLSETNTLDGEGD